MIHSAALRGYACLFMGWKTAIKTMTNKVVCFSKLYKIVTEFMRLLKCDEILNQHKM